MFIILVCNAHLLEMIETGLGWPILRLPILARLSPRIMAALGSAKASFDGINPETKVLALTLYYLDLCSYCHL